MHQMQCVSNAFIKKHENLTLPLMRVCLQPSDSPGEPHNTTPPHVFGCIPMASATLPFY